MTKTKQIFILVFCLSILLLTGCEKKSTEETGKNGDCINVQVPEGSTIDDIFDFKSTHQVYLTNLSSSGTSDQKLNIGTLSNGNSVAWQSDSNFLYILGESNDISVGYYANQLKETPISYEEFKTKYN